MLRTPQSNGERATPVKTNTRTAIYITGPDLRLPRCMDEIGGVMAACAGSGQSDQVCLNDR